jgi:phage shock protein A
MLNSKLAFKMTELYDVLYKLSEKIKALEFKIEQLENEKSILSKAINYRETTTKKKHFY